MVVIKVNAYCVKCGKMFWIIKEERTGGEVLCPKCFMEEPDHDDKTL